MAHRGLGIESKQRPELHVKWKIPFGWSVVSMTQFTLCRKWQVKSSVSRTLRGLRWLRAPEPALGVFQGVGKYPPWGGGNLALEWKGRGRERALRLGPAGLHARACPEGAGLTSPCLLYRSGRWRVRMRPGQLWGLRLGHRERRRRAAPGGAVGEPDRICPLQALVISRSTEAAG